MRVSGFSSAAGAGGSPETGEKVIHSRFLLWHAF
jgi:hypothetical protein